MYWYDTLNTSLKIDQIGHRIKNFTTTTLGPLRKKLDLQFLQPSRIFKNCFACICSSFRHSRFCIPWNALKDSKYRELESFFSEIAQQLSLIRHSSLFFGIILVKDSFFRLIFQ